MTVRVVRRRLAATAVAALLAGTAAAQTQFPPLNAPPQPGFPGAQAPPQAQFPTHGGQAIPRPTVINPPSMPQQGGFGAPQPQQGGADPQTEARLDAMMQEERRDHGVAATDRLHTGAMHGPTPNQIPGGQVITTKGLVALMRQQNVPYLLLDVLGAGETLPGAVNAVAAAQPGSFQDQTQQQFGQFLAQATRGNPETPIITYCQGVQCWMSYNAALRAIKLGYRNVLWYRGGIEAWKYAGLPTQQAMMQMPPGQQMPGQQMPGQQMPGQQMPVRR